MTTFGPAHPLDIDLADLVDGVLDEPRAEQVEAHLADCLLCRVKRLRLCQAPRAGPVSPGGELLGSPEFAMPVVDGGGGDPEVGDIWLAGGEERIIVVVLTTHGDTLRVAPVTLDVEAADDQAVIVDAAHSPLPTGIVLHPALAADLPRAVLAGRVATGLDLPALLGGTGPRGAPIEGDADPRLELRSLLAERLAGLEGTPPSPTGHDQVRSALIDDLRALRGDACAVRALDRWPNVVEADQNGWVPLAIVDEVGIVLVVFDTPHGLVDDRDFDVARAVLTRGNASALVVTTGDLSDLADVFDAASLNHGIDIPSGAHTPPRPLISGLVTYDAVNKYLDQHSGARAMSPPTRGPIARVDVAELLREAAASAVADAVRQGARFKIVPKRRGYEALADAPESLGAALGQAFSGGSVVESLLDLARGDDNDEETP